MRVMRILGYWFVLIMVFMLGGCGLSPTEAQVVVPPTTVVRTAAHPTVVVTPSSSAQTKIPQAPVIVANPTRLIIPAIGVNTAIESLGVLASGDLATPTRNPWDDVGWYNLGPRPGEVGSAVIDGHLDRPGGYPAIFWYLRNLHAGDAITVIDAAGKKLTFSVTRVAAYTPQSAPIQDIFGNQNGTFLNLITCAGDWIPNQHQTTLRLVVYATLVA